MINYSYDWNNFITQENNKSLLHGAKYIAFGWGDKGFYLNTPTWGDLTFNTAFKAAFGLSSSAMHVTYYSQMTENEYCVKMVLCEFQYRELIKNIQNKFKKNSSDLILINTDQNYGQYDSFYEANGTYSIFYTCNVWVTETLKNSKMKAGYWTPFSPEVLGIYMEKNENK